MVANTQVFEPHSVSNAAPHIVYLAVYSLSFPVPQMNILLTALRQAPWCSAVDQELSQLI